MKLFQLNNLKVFSRKMLNGLVHAWKQNDVKIFLSDIWSSHIAKNNYKGGSDGRVFWVKICLKNIH